MISCKDFKYIIERLRETRDIQDKVREIYKNASDNVLDDYMNCGSLMIAHEDLVVTLLCKNLGLEKDNTLEWWLYECDYGRSFKLGDMTEANGTEVDLTTIEKTYDYLIEEGKWYSEQARKEETSETRDE